MRKEVFVESLSISNSSLFRRLCKISEAYKKLQDGWLSYGDKVPPTEFAKYSECHSGKKGGDLGWFPRGKMAGPFQDVVFSTPVGATRRLANVYLDDDVGMATILS
ncbi:hypothetical protein V8G54_008267 [Vigna mungo]|uniref:Peptidyl-prolyl cis-trans isomerase n=1 Tax=Vigna mungo TaxID=3915 RepID=A0AAQ3P3I2_VIGMU